MAARRRSRFTTRRAEQLLRLGLPSILAESLADQVDWHAVADLVERGCG